MAIARRASVTVSMAADTSGRFNWMLRESFVARDVSFGGTWGVRGHQQHIVEGERFSEKAHEKAPKRDCTRDRVTPIVALRDKLGA